MYQILPYTKNRASKIGVVVKPSSTAFKKIDVFDDGKKVASIGDTRYSDYPTYLRKEGKAYADERRRLYHIRHSKDMKKVGSAGYYSGVLLW